MESCCGVGSEVCRQGWTLESFRYGNGGGEQGVSHFKVPIHGWTLMISLSCVLHSLVIFGSKKFHNWGFGRPSLIGFQPSVSNRNRSSVSWSGNSHFTFTRNRYPNSQHVSPCKFMSTRQFPYIFKSATLHIFNDLFFGGDASRVAPSPFRSGIDIRTGANYQTCSRVSPR